MNFGPIQNWGNLNTPFQRALKDVGNGVLFIPVVDEFLLHYPSITP